MIMDRVKTEDAIPYWDYDAPVTKETPRDVSAASVTASAMIELSTMVPDGQKYLDYAEKDSEEFVKRRISCKSG